MIDAIFKKTLDRYWDRVGLVVARTGISPNAITLIGLGLGAVNALCFLAHLNTVLFGAFLALTELLDNVDGAVARVTGRSSRAGAYLDATTDRYKELIPLLAVAQVTGHWRVCFLAVTGSLLVSYTHARAAMESAPPAASGGLPDLFERFERVLVLCVGLILTPLFPADLAFGGDFLFLVLCTLALLTHVTALQRLLRGWRSLDAADRSP